MNRITILDKNNIFLITGYSSLERYCEQGFSSGNFVCDDVIFEKDAVVIFPNENIGSKIKSIHILLKSGSIKKKISSNNKNFFIYNHNGEDKTVYYFSFEMPFLENCSINMLCSIFDSNGKINDFSREITYINSLKYSISSSDTIIANNFFERFSVITPASFQPKNYYIIPYSLYPGNDTFKKSKSPTFRVGANKDYHNAINFGSNLYFSDSQLPVPLLEELSYSSIYMRRGYAKSFINTFEAGIQSAVNDRNNFEQNILFKKKYKYLSEEDFVFEIDEDFGVVKDNRVLLSKNNFKIKPKQALSFYLKSNNGRKFENINNIKFYEKKINNKNITEFEIKEINSFVGKFDSEKLYNVILDSGQEEFWGYNSFSEDYYKNSYCLFETNSGAVYSYKIIKSNYDQIVLEGLAGQIIKNSIKMGIVHYLPDYLEIQPKSKYYRQKRFKLKKSRITQDFLEYESISLDIQENNSLEMDAVFQDSSKNFRGVNVSVTISGKNQFVFVSSQQKTYSITSYLDIDAVDENDLDDSYIKFLNISGSTYHKLVVPNRYKLNLLNILIKTESPVLKENVILKINNAGVIQEFNNNDLGIIHTQENDEGTLFKISINQRLYPYDFIEFEIL